MGFDIGAGADESRSSTLQRDEATGQHRLVAEHGVDARHAHVGTDGTLILLRGLEVLDDCAKHLLRKLLGFAAVHAHERLLRVGGQGGRGEAVGLAGRFFEKLPGNPTGGG